ncbi:MAG TPA: YetF domain-containing protein [Gemmatimonadaceae bacterium]
METVIRVAFFYVLILVLLRIVGKRELSQLSPLELIMLLLIPELVSQALVREDFSMTNAVVAITTLMSLVFITSALVYRFKRVGELLEGTPALLVEKGHPIRATMDRERITPEDIAAEMRKAGIERLDFVQWAVLEADGKISIIGYRPEAGHAPPEKRAT